jgi:ParB family chromosome partitioning protein
MPDIQNIALRHLVLSPLNVRKTRTKENIEQMAASILSQGLLQNLRVHTQEQGSYAVVIGGTRLAALQLLLKQKKITEDYQVACEVRPANDPTLLEASLSENMIRSSMHPADEFDAFKALADEGHGPETVAARFGQTATYVKQRLRLAGVSPKLLKVFRAGEMTLDEVMAFTISDDHKSQERCWKDLPKWARQRGDGDQIRKMLTAEHVASDSKLAVFVGDAYEKAKGGILPDLFAEEGAPVFLTDPELLNRIVEEKLSEAAEAVKAEGWKWVRHAPNFSYEETSKDGRLHPAYVEPTAEAQAELEKLQAESDEIMEAEGEEPEDPEIYAKLEQLGERMDVLREGERIWTDEQKTASGVYVSISHDGELHILRGVVKPEDKAAARKLDGAAGQPGDDKPAKPKGGLPASLIAELTSHKTKAAQLVLSSNAAVALRAVTHALAIRLLYDRDTDTHTSLRINANEPTFPFAIREQIDKSATGKKLDAVETAWRKKLPKEPDLLWAWIEKQPKATVESLLAVCAALTVDVVQVNGNEAKASSNHLTTAIKLDMSQFWTASAENYFTCVPKKLLLEELGTAVSAATKRQIEAMKRADAAKAITTELKGRKWLPPIMKNE